MSPRKHAEPQPKEKKDTQLEKVVDIKEDEYQGVEEVDGEEIDPISRILEYNPPQKGKTKVTKDPDPGKFWVDTPLLLEQVTFEGPKFAYIPLLKMEDWDLADHEKFLHLATHKYMKNIYYDETRVT